MDQIKIYDVAGSAGVSLATVSRVLNHPEKVKPATREKVLKIIKEKGYKPNANARGLASRKSTTVAIVVPTLTSTDETTFQSSLEYFCITNTIIFSSFSVIAKSTFSSLKSLSPFLFRIVLFLKIHYIYSTINK